MVYGLTYKSLIHFEFIFCMVLILFFTCSCPVFPESHMEQPVFYPLNNLASLVIDWWILCTWVYIWTFHAILLIYISVFLSVPYCFHYCSLQCGLTLGSLIIPAVEFFFFKIAFAIQSLFCFYRNLIFFVLVLSKFPLVICQRFH